jgi:hypothetical protein
LQTYEIRTIRSGFEETLAWLSVWYRADPGKLDVLHIVVSAPEHRDGMEPVYLERHDQSIACYGGAKRIVVGDRSIEIHLNAKGAKALSLGRSMTLAAPEKLSGWKKATKLLRTIAGDPSGGVITMASP